MKLTFEVVFSVFLLILLVTALIFDLSRAKIPNRITFPGMVIGILGYALTEGVSGLGTSIMGILIGGVVFFPFYLLKGMGAGDIKLMAAVGALVGYPRIIPVIVFTALAGGVYALIVIILNPWLLKRFFYSVFSLLKTLFFTGQIIFLPVYDQNREKPNVRYGVAIAVGTVFAQWCWPYLKINYF